MCFTNSSSGAGSQSRPGGRGNLRLVDLLHNGLGFEALGVASLLKWLLASAAVIQAVLFQNADGIQRSSGQIGQGHDRRHGISFICGSGPSWRAKAIRVNDSSHAMFNPALPRRPERHRRAASAMLALGSRYGEGPVLISTLAKDESIPVKFLELILLDLKSHGLLESKKGKGGGYLLTRPPSTLTIGSLLRILEGPLAALPCASETAFRPCEECVDVESCGTRIILRQVRDATADILDRTSLADLLRRVQTAREGKKASRSCTTSRM
jgi:Rrf2 family protein